MPKDRASETVWLLDVLAGGSADGDLGAGEFPAGRGGVGGESPSGGGAGSGGGGVGEVEAKRQQAGFASYEGSRWSRMMTVFIGRGWLLMAFLLASLTAACTDDLPGMLRTDDKLYYNVVGGVRLAVPANYLASQSLGVMHVIASWPEMGGRVNDAEGYKHYTQSHISILADPARPNVIDIDYEVSLVRKNIVGQRDPEPTGSEFGFEHAIVRYGSGDVSQFASHYDIYTRRNTAGRFEAVMKCDGVPTARNLRPQCELFEEFPELPGIHFNIGFGREKVLSQVNIVEQAVRDKFLEFKRAGDKAFRDDPVAREQFLKMERKLEEIRKEPFTYAKDPPGMPEWFRNWPRNAKDE